MVGTLLLFFSECDRELLALEIQRFSIIEKPYAKVKPPKKQYLFAEILSES